MKKIIALLFLFSLLALSLVSCNLDGDKVTYDTAVDYISQGKYSEAYALFKELGDYEDSAEYLSRCLYFVGYHSGASQCHERNNYGELEVKKGLSQIDFRA